MLTRELLKSIRNHCKDDKEYGYLLEDLMNECNVGSLSELTYPEVKEFY